MQLQQVALQLSAELNRMDRGRASHILQVGQRGHALTFAGAILYARQRAVRQARMLLKQVEEAMAVNAVTRVA